jgi:acyl carrier protein
LAGNELLDILKDRLPVWMCPSMIVPTAALPLKDNGKVDRGELARMASRESLPKSDNAHGTRTERLIAAVWSELLNIDRVGLADNFFDLGANSLLVLKAHEKLCEALQVELSPIDLFKFPTVSALARRIDRPSHTSSFDDSSTRADRQREALRALSSLMERS